MWSEISFEGDATYIDSTTHTLRNVQIYVFVRFECERSTRSQQCHFERHLYHDNMLSDIISLTSYRVLVVCDVITRQQPAAI